MIVLIEHFSNFWFISVLIWLLFNCLITDVDECAQGTDECHLNATCDNTIGSYTCECVTGLTGNGITCDGMYMYILENGQFG